MMLYQLRRTVDETEGNGRQLTVRVGNVGRSVPVLVGVHKQSVVRRTAKHNSICRFRAKLSQEQTMTKKLAIKDKENNFSRVYQMQEQLDQLFSQLFAL